MEVTQRLHLTAFSDDDQSFEFIHAYTTVGDDGVVETHQNADYRVEYEITDDPTMKSDGDYEIVREREDGPPVYLFVSVPTNLGGTVGYEISPDDFQGLHEAIAHKVEKIAYEIRSVI